MGFREVENFHVLFSGTYYLRIKLANLLLRFEVVKLVR